MSNSIKTHDPDNDKNKKPIDDKSNYKTQSTNNRRNSGPYRVPNYMASNRTTTPNRMTSPRTPRFTTPSTPGTPSPDGMTTPRTPGTTSPDGMTRPRTPGTTTPDDMTSPRTPRSTTPGMPGTPSPGGMTTPRTPGTTTPDGMTTPRTPGTTSPDGMTRPRTPGTTTPDGMTSPRTPRSTTPGMPGTPSPGGMTTPRTPGGSGLPMNQQGMPMDPYWQYGPMDRYNDMNQYQNNPYQEMPYIVCPNVQDMPGNMYVPNNNHHSLPMGIPLMPIYGYDNSADLDRDIDQMRRLYPRAVRAIEPYIKDECDKLEYDGSIMFDEYPDQVTIDRIVDRIYEKTKHLQEEVEVEAQYIYPRRRRNNFRDILTIILLNEFINRRRRHRSRRRWF